jgi:hypothetical protein
VVVAAMPPPFARGLCTTEPRRGCDVEGSALDVQHPLDQRAIDEAQSVLLGT